MKTFYEDNNIQLYEGDAREILSGMDNESVNCVMTSPPYWGLRSYGTESQIWGGNRGCKHRIKEKIVVGETTVSARWQHSKNGLELQSGRHQTRFKGDLAKVQEERTFKNVSTGICIKCGAWKGELGLEPTPEIYISHLADVFDAVKRVLKKDGTLWVNLGDSYAGSGRGIGSDSDPKWPKARNDKRKHKQNWDTVSLQAKNLMLIPSRFAIEMQNRGWILRNDIIWHKPNPMPSSVKDRMTNCYEHLFFFVKSQKYWYDSDAIREPHLTNVEYESGKSTKWGNKKKNTNKPNVDKYRGKFGKENSEIYNSPRARLARGNYEPSYYNPAGRNAFDVWKIPTEPLSDEHYAAYPQKLCERPIKAGCPKDGVVLDPFCGSGTTLLVARRLGRKSIGIDLKYQDIALRRLNVNQQRLNI